MRRRRRSGVRFHYICTVRESYWLCIMSMNDSDIPMTLKDIKVWKRMVDKRKEAWKSTPRSELVAIIAPVWNKEEGSLPGAFAVLIHYFTVLVVLYSNFPYAQVIEDAWERAEWLLMKHFRQAVDQTLSPDTRRTSWDKVTFLLQQLDGKYL